MEFLRKFGGNAFVNPKFISISSSHISNFKLLDSFVYLPIRSYVRRNSKFVSGQNLQSNRIRIVSSVTRNNLAKQGARPGSCLAVGQLLVCGGLAEVCAQRIGFVFYDPPVCAVTSTR